MTENKNNLWRATAHDRPPFAALSGDRLCDTVVVGAGIMGLSAALGLAKAGASVTVVEAGRIGSGASSTPGGFVVPHFSVGSPRSLIDEHGSAGEALVEMVGQSADRLFKAISELELDCDARQDGWYHPATPAALPRLDATIGQWREAGFDAERLDAAETTRRTGIEGYGASWYAKTGGTIHPLKLCQELARCAAAHGAMIHEHTPATDIVRHGKLYHVQTPAGLLKAEKVIICTNGLSKGLSSLVDRTIVPMRVWQCATAPIPAEQRAHLFQGGECLSDTRHNLFTYRFDVQHRLITGTFDALGVDGPAAAQAMARRLRDMLRLPKVPEIEFCWAGTSAISASRMPLSLHVDGGLLAASSCNARGIALSFATGGILADHALDRHVPPLPMLGQGGRTSALVQSRLSRLYAHLTPLFDWYEDRKAHNRSSANG